MKAGNRSVSILFLCYFNICPTRMLLNTYRCDGGEMNVVNVVRFVHF